MMFVVPNVLTKTQVLEFRALLESADWVDGKVTAGHQGERVKNNFQLPEHCDLAKKLGDEVLLALEKNPTFISFALPLKVYPPMFNKYEIDCGFGNHIDNSIRQIRGTPFRVRTDISSTLFLSEPDEYEGGELMIEEAKGNSSFKLEAGSLILYPSALVHRVNKITKGRRISCFFWIQSMVKIQEHRSILFELDKAISGIQSEESVKLVGIYHNLLRLWSET